MDFERQTREIGRLYGGSGLPDGMSELNLMPTSRNLEADLANNSRSFDFDLRTRRLSLSSRLRANAPGDLNGGSSVPDGMSELNLMPISCKLETDLANNSRSADFDLRRRRLSLSSRLRANAPGDLDSPS